MIILAIGLSMMMVIVAVGAFSEELIQVIKVLKGK